MENPPNIENSTQCGDHQQRQTNPPDIENLTQSGDQQQRQTNLPDIENPTQSGDQQQRQTILLDGDHSKTPSPSIIDQLILDGNYSKVLSSSVIEQFLNSEQSKLGTVSENPNVSSPSTARPATPILDNLIFNSVRAITPSDINDATINAGGLVTPPITRTSPVIKPLLDNTVVGPSTGYISPMAIKPVPKMKPNVSTGRRKAQRAEILTSTPFKGEQREKMAKNHKVGAEKD